MIKQVAIGTARLQNGDKLIVGVIDGVQYHYVSDFNIWYSNDGRVAPSYSKLLTFAYQKYLLEVVLGNIETSD